MNEVKETIKKELTSEQILNDLITYKEVVKKFSKTSKTTPYQMLMLALGDYFQSTQDIQMFLTQQGILNGDEIVWYSINNNNKKYKLSGWNQFWKDLQTNNLVTLNGTLGRNGITNVSLNDYASQMIDTLYDAIVDFRNNADKILTEQTDIDVEVSVDKVSPTMMFSFSQLPNSIKGQLTTNAEEGYFRLLDSVVREYSHGEDTIKMKTMPVFFNIDEDMKTSKFNPEYFKGGLTLLEGYVVGYSKLKELNMGKVLRCPVDHRHSCLNTDDTNKVLSCVHCGNGTEMEEETRVDMPIYELKIDLGNGDKMRAMVHAELWQPSLNQGNMQKLLLFKMSNQGKFKLAKDVDYLVVGYEVKEELKADKEEAKYIAEKSTQEILDLFDNSLFSDIIGNKTLKDLAVITMGSINTQRLRMYARGSYVNKRGILNTLFYGVPGTAKTQIARRMVDLVRVNIADAQAGNTSEAGWTAAYEKNEGIVRPGLIPMNNTRAVLVDELDKFANGYAFLLSPLEDKKINWAKAGITAEFNAHTVIYMTANNINPLDEEDLIEQLKQEIDRKGKVNNPVISRTDLICVLKEGVSASDMLSGLLEGSTGEIVSEDKLQNYVLCMREIEEVTVNPDSIKALAKVLKKYQVNPSNAGRLIESCFRVAGAIAKLHLRDVVTEQDLEEGMKYYLAMLKTLGQANPIESVEILNQPTKSERAEKVVCDLLTQGPMSTDELQLAVTGVKDVVPVLNKLNLQLHITKDSYDGIVKWRLV
jgi:MoxR-like ATPase